MGKLIVGLPGAAPARSGRTDAGTTSQNDSRSVAIHKRVSGIVRGWKVKMQNAEPVQWSSVLEVLSRADLRERLPGHSFRRFLWKWHGASNRPRRECSACS